eukprot:SAG31_NODE_1422_length_8420_cov_2.887514_4_plen_345_part_00
MQKYLGVIASLFDQMFYETGNYTEAECCYTAAMTAAMAIDDRPMAAICQANRAAARVKCSQWVDALEDCKAALDSGLLDPDGVAAKCKARAACCLRQLGRLVEAADLAAEAGGALGASEIAATDAVLLSLANAQMAVFDGDPSLAATEIARIRERGQCVASPAVLGAEASCLLRKGVLAEAAAGYSKAAELAETSRGAHDAAGLRIEDPVDHLAEGLGAEEDTETADSQTVAWNTIRIEASRWREEQRRCEDAMALKEAGNTAVAQGNYASAEQAYTAAIGRIDSCSVLWSNLALVFLQRPEPSAEYALLVSLALRPVASHGQSFTCPSTENCLPWCGGVRPST